MSSCTKRKPQRLLAAQPVQGMQDVNRTFPCTGLCMKKAGEHAPALNPETQTNPFLYK